MRPKRFFETFNPDDISIGEYGVLSVAVQLKVFEFISDGCDTETILKNKMPHAQSAVGPLLGALVSYGYLARAAEERFVLSDVARRHLLPESPASSLPFLLGHQWYALPITAAPGIVGGQQPRISQSTLDAIVDISYRLGKKLLPTLKADLPFLLKEKCRALDLGCGKMPVLLELAVENPGLAVVGIERNRYALAFVRDEIRRRGLRQRVKIVAGDAESVELSRWAPFDFILLSHILHWVKEDNVSHLLARCRAALPSDGMLVIFEDFLDKAHGGPRESLRKNLILSLLGFRLFDVAELRGMLTNTGFSRIRTRLIGRRRVLLYASG